MAFVKLQKQLLTDILKGEHTIRNVYEGIGKIRTILCCKKVLLQEEEEPEEE